MDTAIWQLAAAAAGGASVFVLLAVLMHQRSAARLASRVSAYQRGAAALPEVGPSPSVLQELGQRARLLSLLTLALPAAVSADIERRLRLAGEPLSLHGFLSLQFAVIGVAAVGVAVLIGLGLTGFFALGGIAGGVAVSAIPLLWLQSMGERRQDRVVRALPDAVDFIVTMVEAGLSIDAALWRVANETSGPLAAELGLAMREVTLGRSRRDALLGLLRRTDVPELRAFIHAILHAQDTGVPLGHVLRTQAREIRLKRRQRAEAKAATIPVKMLLLMLFFIMPSLLLVLLGPAALRMADMF